MNTTHVRGVLSMIGMLAIGAAALSGCADGPGAAGPAPTAPTVSPESVSDSLTDAPAGPAQVARAQGPTEVFDAPEGSLTRTLDATTRFGSHAVFLVTGRGPGEEAGWLEVMLPGRPNGARGWVRATAVDVREVTLEVRVDLAARELVLLDDGQVLWSTPTAIGTPDNPTPTGSYYVTDKLDTGETEGSYGPYAIGLSGRSEVLTEFAGGDGQIGIHGTNTPSSIGQAVSHGCLRIDNALVAELAAVLPLGTPVTIS